MNISMYYVLIVIELCSYCLIVEVMGELNHSFCFVINFRDET